MFSTLTFARTRFLLKLVLLMAVSFVTVTLATVVSDNPAKACGARCGEVWGVPQCVQGTHQDACYKGPSGCQTLDCWTEIQ